MPAIWKCSAGGLVLLGLLSMATACSEEKFGRVSGQVTLDGKPVKNADLEFEPEVTGAAPSYARADDEGRYTLKYSATKEGAEVGTHLVRITTARSNGNGKLSVKERLPPKFHRASELVREVKAGDNVIDFELTKR